MASIYDILTVAHLKETVLAGIELTDVNGDPLPDAMFENAIESAVAQIEQTLNIVIDPITIKNERHDSRVDRADAFWPFHVDRRPLASVSRVGLQYGTYPQATLPDSWIIPREPANGNFQVVPSGEAIGIFPTVTAFWMWADNFPAYWSFDYRAGFPTFSGTITIPEGESEGTATFTRTQFKLRHKATVVAGTVTVSDRSNESINVTISPVAPPGGTVVTWTVVSLPANLVHAILLTASFQPLAVAGDNILGPGIASKAKSIDGLSESVTTTASAMYSGFSARQKTNEAELKRLLSELRGEYRSTGLAFI